jgi:DNA-binding XRE family transcriptional regulator
MAYRVAGQPDSVRWTLMSGPDRGYWAVVWDTADFRQLYQSPDCESQRAAVAAMAAAGWRPAQMPKGLDFPAPHMDPEPLDASDIKAWRERLGLTQGEAAERIGVKLRAYQNYEAGHPIPLPVQRLCRYIEAESA